MATASLHASIKVNSQRQAKAAMRFFYSRSSLGFYRLPGLCMPCVLAAAVTALLCLPGRNTAQTHIQELRVF